jgi:hypothetical protein
MSGMSKSRRKSQAKSKAKSKGHKWIDPRPLPDDDRWTEDELPLNLADIADAVPETDEPPLCSCGKHYVGAPCKQGHNPDK